MELAKQRPSLTRSQSSIEPSKRTHPTLHPTLTHPSPLPDGTTANSPLLSISPAAASLRTALTLPAEPSSSSRLHIPKPAHLLRSDPDRRRTVSRHRHTHSDAQNDHLSGIHHRRDKSDGLAHLTASMTRERGRRLDVARLPHGLRGIRGDELGRVASNESDRPPRSQQGALGAPFLRRASSDPKLQARRAEKKPIELVLELAEEKKMASRAAVSRKDVDAIRKRNKQGQNDLKRRLGTINQSSVDILGRLDHTFYGLLETVGDLVATVQSFHSLSSESKATIDAFTEVASTLESDVKSKAEAFTSSFHDRQARVQHLEARGDGAEAHARDLSDRLETARARLAAWEEKDGADRRRRSWFWRSAWTVLATLVLLIFFALTWQEWRSQVDLVRSALNDETLNWNQTLPVDGTVVSGTVAAEDAQGVASEILQKRRSRSAASSSSSSSSKKTLAPTKVDRARSDKDWLRILDEL